MHRNTARTRSAEYTWTGRMRRSPFAFRNARSTPARDLYASTAASGPMAPASRLVRTTYIPSSRASASILSGLRAQSIPSSATSKCFSTRRRFAFRPRAFTVRSRFAGPGLPRAAAAAMPASVSSVACRRSSRFRARSSRSRGFRQTISRSPGKCLGHQRRPSLALLQLADVARLQGRYPVQPRGLQVLAEHAPCRCRSGCGLARHSGLVTRSRRTSTATGQPSAAQSRP